MARRRDKLEFEFLGEPVTKSNETFFNAKQKRVFHKTSTSKYEKELKAAALSYMQESESNILSGLVNITILYYMGSKRRKDLLNLPKTTCDALNEVVYNDDFQIHEAHLYRRLDRKRPRVRIIIEEMSDSEWETG